MNDDDLTPEQQEFVNEITGKPKPFRPTINYPGVPLGSMYFDTSAAQIRVHDGTRWVTPTEMHVTNPFTGSYVTMTVTTSTNP